MGRDGALRRHRAVQARNTFGEIERGGSIRSARCTRAGTAQRAARSLPANPEEQFSFSGSTAAPSRRNTTVPMEDFGLYPTHPQFRGLLERIR
jgi:hypothetical protein